MIPNNHEKNEWDKGRKYVLVINDIAFEQRTGEDREECLEPGYIFPLEWSRYSRRAALDAAMKKDFDSWFDQIRHHRPAKVIRLMVRFAAMETWFKKYPGTWGVAASAGLTKIDRSEVMEAMNAHLPNITQKEKEKMFTLAISSPGTILGLGLGSYFKKISLAPGGRDDSDLVAEAFINYIDQRFPEEKAEALASEAKPRSNIVPFRLKV
ncbi:MAG: hypothetical protein LBL72_06430 [Candidatus Accumulibacter sp.]|jgi:hypothetical protein|nr:hypothetical protein [Accumulibacter sp.]